MNASKYTEELGKFEGRARELVEAKLRAETDRLVAAEPMAERTLRAVAHAGSWVEQRGAWSRNRA